MNLVRQQFWSEENLLAGVFGKKCGIITVFEESLFQLNCIFCHNVFSCLENFVKHIRIDHAPRSVENLTNDTGNEGNLEQLDPIACCSVSISEESENEETSNASLYRECREVQGDQSEDEAERILKNDENYVEAPIGDDPRGTEDFCVSKLSEGTPLNTIPVIDLNPYKTSSPTYVTLQSGSCPDLPKKISPTVRVNPPKVSRVYNAWKLGDPKNRELDLYFIKIYKSFPCLWDKKSKDYTSEKRNETLDDIKHLLKQKWNCEIETKALSRKIYFLAKMYEREVWNRKEGTVSEDVKAPWFFKELLFLDDQLAPKYKCEECDKVFRSEFPFNHHKCTDDGISLFVCNVCKKEFTQANKLRNHALIHLDVDDRHFECKICGRKFAQQLNYQIHMRRHTKENSHACSECGKLYPTKTELKNHMRSHTGEKPFVCHICGMSFKFIPVYYRHRSRHSEKFDYKCTKCPKEFHTYGNLHAHLQTHLTTRDKLCNICGKGFKNAQSLRQHKQIHEEQKKYVCKICKKDFAQGAGLYSHMKSHNIVTFAEDGKRT